MATLDELNVVLNNFDASIGINEDGTIEWFDRITGDFVRGYYDGNSAYNGFKTHTHEVLPDLNEEGNFNDEDLNKYE